MRNIVPHGDAVDRCVTWRDSQCGSEHRYVEQIGHRLCDLGRSHIDCFSEPVGAVATPRHGVKQHLVVIQAKAYGAGDNRVADRAARHIVHALRIHLAGIGVTVREQQQRGTGVSGGSERRLHFTQGQQVATRKIGGTTGLDAAYRVNECFEVVVGHRTNRNGDLRIVIENDQAEAVVLPEPSRQGLDGRAGRL